MMDNSIFEARWLLAPVVGLCIVFLALGLIAA
jgi:hypothetical protein